MKKIIYLIVAILFVLTLTGCDFGQGNTDYNIHVKGTPTIIVKEEPSDFKEVQSFYAYTDNGWVYGFNYNDYAGQAHGYYNSTTKIFKEVSSESTRYFEFFGCNYVQVIYK